MNANKQRSRADASRLTSLAEGAGASVTHDEISRRFEVRVGDRALAFLSYLFEGNCVAFEYTFVPNELRGKGIASNLTRAALKEARQRGWRIIPRCSYVTAFLKRNPEFADLVAPEARQ
jgi:predicted GNAT family acetyltransferase